MDPLVLPAFPSFLFFHSLFSSHSFLLYFATLLTLCLKLSGSQQGANQIGRSWVRLHFLWGRASQGCSRLPSVRSEPTFVDVRVLTYATLQSFHMLHFGDLPTHILQDLVWFLP